MESGHVHPITHSPKLDKIQQAVANSLKKQINDFGDSWVSIYTSVKKAWSKLVNEKVFISLEETKADSLYDYNYIPKTPMNP